MAELEGSSESSSKALTAQRGKLRPGMEKARGKPPDSQTSGPEAQPPSLLGHCVQPQPSPRSWLDGRRARVAVETSRAKHDVPPGERRRLGARAAPTPRPGRPPGAFLRRRPPRTKGQRPRGPRARKRGVPGRPGGGWRARGSWPRATPYAPGLGARPGAPRGGRGESLAQQVPGPPAPARPRPQPRRPPAHPPARPADQAPRLPPRRAHGSRSAAGRRPRSRPP